MQGAERRGTVKASVQQGVQQNAQQGVQYGVQQGVPLGVRPGESNPGTILNLLRRFPHSSQADLARRTGLQPSTVSNLVRELVRDRWIVAHGRGASPPGGGKPSTLLALNPDRGRYLALLWTSSTVEAALVDCAGSVVATMTERCSNWSDSRKLISDCVQRLLVTSGTDRGSAEVPLLAAGMAVGSVVDRAGRVRPSADFSHSLPEAPAVLRDAILATGMADGAALLPTVVENDANCIAIQAGQRSFQKAGHVLALVFLREPPSVGAGLLMENRLWRGVHGSAGELLSGGARHTIRDLDRAAAIAIRFADPEHVVVSLPVEMSWEELRATRAVVEEAAVTMESVCYRDEALSGAASLAFRRSVETTDMRVAGAKDR
jgi:DNA-binding Lrp family transcriptional regulator